MSDKIKTVFLIGIFCFALLVNFSYCQPVQFRFKNFTVKDGISAKEYGQILQDSRGFLWIATQNGLNRYNGISFQKFYNNSSDSNSLSGNVINSMTEMPGGLLLIGTNDGLSVYNIYNNRFENFRLKKNYSVARKNIFIRNVFTDSEKNLWVNYNGIIDIFDSLLNFKVRFTDSPEGKFLKGITIVYNHSTIDDCGNLWIPSDNMGVVMVENKTLKVTCFKNSHDSLFQKMAIRGFYFDKQNKIIWYSPWGYGLLKFDVKDKTLKNYSFAPKGTIFSNTYNTINGIIPWNDKLILGSESGGLFDFNPVDGTSKIYIHDIYNPSSLASDEISRMYLDKEQNLWIANSEALSKVHLAKSPFHYFSNEFRTGLNQPLAELTSMTLYDSCCLLVGTMNNGLSVIDLKSGAVKQKIVSGTLSGYENIINRVYVDKMKNIWVGTAAGFFFYDIIKNVFTRPSGIFATIPNDEVSAIFQDSHDDYWFGFRSGLSLVHYSNAEKKMKRYYYHDKHGSQDFPLYYINKIKEDPKGNIWFSTVLPEGFALWNRTSDSFIQLPATKYTDEHFSESICDVMPDSGNTIWLASGAGHGLLRYNYVSNKTESFSRSYGLNNEIVKSIARDHEGNLWLGTHSGLAVFNPVERKFKNFDLTDGLPDEEFTRTSFFDTASNLVYLLTSHAVVYFNPRDLNKKETTPNLYIQKIQINGKDTTVDLSQPLQLSYNRNYISIEYTCVDFKNGDKIRFSYFLEGLDAAWNEAGNNTFANYSNLAPGKYIFKLKTSAGNDASSTEINALTFTIFPPFWSTWWFRIIVALLSGGCIACAVALYFRRKINIEYRAFEQQQRINSERTRISSELHDDLGSGLTKIVMMGDQLRKNADTKNEQLISRMSSFARELVDNMNDIIWALNMRNDSLQNLIAHIHKYGYEYFDDSKIKLQMLIPEMIPEAALSGEARRNIFLVVKEALHNISKHSMAEIVFIHIELSGKVILVNISDDGRGFANNNSGNGLRNMKQRMIEIGGTFTIDSPAKNDKGTHVSVSFPFS